MNLRTSLPVALTAFLLSGCATTITNLTPGHLPRNANNLYPFEVELRTSQQSLRQDTLRAQVMIGEEIFPMRPVQKLKNRWEAEVPVPAGENHVYYRYKFDYLYDRIPKPGSSSRLSPTYKLEIVDR